MLHPLACKLLCVMCCPLHCLAGWHVCHSLSPLFYAFAIASYVSICFPMHFLHLPLAGCIACMFGLYALDCCRVCCMKVLFGVGCLQRGGFKSCSVCLFCLFAWLSAVFALCLSGPGFACKVHAGYLALYCCSTCMLC